MACECGVDCASQASTVHRDLAAGTAVIELAVVDKPPVLIIKEEVRSADRLVGLGHLLRFVMAEGKRELEAARHAAHSLGRIVRIAGGVVGADGEDAERAVSIIARHGRNAALYVSHVRAVRAEKHHQECRVF